MSALRVALKEHLEDFLVKNWAQTELSKEFDIYEEDGEKTGQQYPTDTGPMDILAISKDKKRLLVVELKKGRASGAVVGQTLRYMGYVQVDCHASGLTVAHLLGNASAQILPTYVKPLNENTRAVIEALDAARLAHLSNIRPVQ